MATDRYDELAGEFHRKETPPCYNCENLGARCSDCSRWIGHLASLLRSIAEPLERELRGARVSRDGHRHGADVWQARAEQAEAKLALWRAYESLPDCPACARLAGELDEKPIGQ